MHGFGDRVAAAPGIFRPMPTPSEQKALAFVAIVILLGGAVRVVRAGSAAGPTESEQQALAGQSTAADQAATDAANKKGKKTARSRRQAPSTRDTVAQVVAGVSSVPPTFARPGDPFSHTPYGSASSRTGFPPPGPRIDVDYRKSAPLPRATIDRTEPSRIDLDVASAADIDKLPRVGPAMAKRIVANRDSFGAFKSLDGLGRVKGLGDATLQRLRELVTFSGVAPARAEH